MASSKLVLPLPLLPKKQDQSKARRLTLSPLGEFPDDILLPILGAATFLFAIAGFVLLIACANVGSLLLARATARRGEIGVRLALGASARQILAPFMATGVRPALLGIVLGTAAAAWLNRFLEPVLFDVAPTDGTTFAVMIVLLLGVAAAAAWIPASRATLIDPARSLRGD